MLYQLSGLFASVFGPLRLLQSYTVLISIGLLLGFLLTVFFAAEILYRAPQRQGQGIYCKPRSCRWKTDGGRNRFYFYFYRLRFFTDKTRYNSNLYLNFNLCCYGDRLFGRQGRKIVG